MDLQFIQFNDALELTGVSEIPDFSPRTLQLFGVDLRHTIDVVINEESSPSFVVAAKNSVLAQVPDSQVDSVIRSVTAVSSDFTATFRSLLTFKIGADPRKATGLKSLMQTFLKLLLTTPGTDAFAKRIGGGAQRIVGTNIDLSNQGGLVSGLAIAVSRAATQMRALQSHQTRLDDDERLLAANLLNVKFDPATTALNARVELIPQSGTRAVLNLEL